MAAVESMNSRSAEAATREQPATLQASMFRGYVIVTLAVICWAGVVGVVVVGLALFS